MTRLLNRSLWTLYALLSAAVAIFSYRYLPRIGPLGPEILANLFARPWLDVHVAGAATALLVGPLQFLPWVRRRFPALHRTLGRVYVIGCLAGGVGGLVMAFGSTAGPIATVGFASLAVCWITANVQGWRLAVARRFDDHRAWMLRSFAMTFAAVTLRIYIVVLPMMGVAEIDAYRASAFLAWIPNLLLVELYLRGRRERAVAA
ncbi:DUF2306 domain-containing protein [Caulobacter sp. UNC358MFTsu5.1]|uniref:DUF2306 domain-containing protein n=1 Tax=Caulobacter sp. UNC358MFTsu5.1 TaxID=1449049 RepID=UPI0004A70021|nr:DUF2306 domain-containing protein [Caulobacter sp. UNC358MFTsu5.1]